MTFLPFLPRKLVVWWKQFVYRSSVHDAGGGRKDVYTRWEQDYNLQNVERLECLDEYLEMGDPWVIYRNGFCRPIEMVSVDL